MMVAAAATYLEDVVRGLRQEELGRETPCLDWNLLCLLLHVGDSLDVLSAAFGGRPPRPTRMRSDASGLEMDIRARAAETRRAAYGVVAENTVPIADRKLDVDLLLAVAALEMTVHAWDVATARGRPQGIPADLADALLAPAKQTGSSQSRV